MLLSIKPLSISLGLIVLLSVFFMYSCDNSTDSPAAPEINSISPLTGPPGTAVTITGSGFSSNIADVRVTFNGFLGDISSSTDNEIQATVPQLATSGAVEVVVNGLTAVGPNFTVESGAVGISSIEPDSAQIGEQITINGMNFSSSPNDNIVIFNGGIVAEVAQASESQLVVTVPQGTKSGPILVTTDGNTTSSPSFTVLPAPEIAFLSNKSGNVDIWTIRIDGTDLRNITGEFNEDKGEFSWSPDGSRIAYISELFGNSEIWIVTASGDNIDLTNSTTGTELDPQWSPDGNFIIHSSDTDGNYDIWIMNSDASNLTNLTNDPATDLNARWNPISAEIAFISDRSGNNDIWVMNSDGTNPVNLTNDPGIDEFPVWSPDGSKIAFNSDRSGDNEVWIMNSDGSNPVNLTNNPGIDEFPVWSPDGSQILFQSLRNGYRDIWVVNSDGSDQVNISQGHGVDPQWSTDGSKILFTSNRTADSEIWVLNADGSSLTQVTSNPGFSDTSPRWRP